ncbi:MAG: aminodeoxychorismate/anthranilate synthase component II [Bacteroidetes bacterium]|nr:MAG: aminodeoxychorismate/anthranilate synthase component II [Bacteroidota bacterium]
MILIIDNYDSFTYNLADLVLRHTEACVLRNDALTLDDIAEMKPEGIVISPGPGRPEDSGISLPAVARFYTEIPVLGVCLGLQTIGQVLGARVVHAPRPMHGKTSMIRHDGQGLFAGLPSPLRVMRYHSLVLDPGTIPEELEVQALTIRGEIMGIRHKMHKLSAVQFHPESALSVGGERLVRNWLDSLRN